MNKFKFILLLLLLTSVFSSILPTFKLKASTNTYPYGNEPSPSLNCEPDDWGFCKWNCTSYAAWKVRENYLSDFINGYTHNNNYQIYGHAATWDNAALEQGFSVSSSPSVGSFGIWEATGCEANDPYGYQGRCNEAGHIAYVESLNGDGSINVSQYNINYSGAYSEATLAGSNLPGSYITFGTPNNETNSCSGIGILSISGSKANYNCGVNSGGTVLIAPSSNLSPDIHIYTL